jgi:hypothetical protein
MVSVTLSILTVKKNTVFSARNGKIESSTRDYKRVTVRRSFSFLINGNCSLLCQYKSNITVKCVRNEVVSV